MDATASRACSPGSAPSATSSAELDSHLQLHIDDNLRAGMTPAEARRRAADRARRRRADQGGLSRSARLPGLESLIRDLRYGARTLFKSPGFALAGIVILGLGIGVNSAIFTVVNAVVLRPLPFAEADRIVRLWHTPPQSTFPGMRTSSRCRRPTSSTGRRRARSFEAMAIYRGGQPTLTGQGEPTAVQSLRASASFLPIFGAAADRRPRLHADDDRAGAAADGAAQRGRSGAAASAPIPPSSASRSCSTSRPTPWSASSRAPSFLEEVQVWTPLLLGARRRRRARQPQLSWRWPS